MQDTQTKWFQEIHKGNRAFALTVKETLYHQKSQYQDILIFSSGLIRQSATLSKIYFQEKQSS
jgi:spermidine synthase